MLTTAVANKPFSAKSENWLIHRADKLGLIDLVDVPTHQAAEFVRNCSDGLPVPRDVGNHQAKDSPRRARRRRNRRLPPPSDPP